MIAAGSTQLSAALAQQTPAAEALAGDPWWLVLVKAVAVFAFLVVLTLFAIWAERRLMGFMQMRLGPNRAGPFGILQSLADGIKLGLKEDIIPRGTDKLVYVIAPMLSTVPAFLAFAVIPFGPTVSIFGHETALQLTDLPVAVLFVLAMSSMGVYGIVLAGWSSGSTYPLLGGLRSAAQVVSYEIAMGLSFVAVFLFSGSLSTSGIVAAQRDLWFVVILFPSFVIYSISMVGETNRAPFDLAEAEGELVGGFHTEYSSLKFALFFLAEYINMAMVSALSVTLFLGGWRAPWPISLWDAANTGWWPLLWFLGKLLVMLFVFVWLRTTLPRFRYDQFMHLGWKGLIPISLAWIVAVSVVRAVSNQGFATQQILIGIAAVFVVIFAASFLWEMVNGRRAALARAEGRAEGEAAAPAPGPAQPGDSGGAGYPVPPLDAPHYHGAADSNARKEVSGA